MKKYLLILLLFVSAAGMAQAPNIIYGKDVIISTRDTSSAELTIKNNSRNVLGFFKNIGGGKGQYILLTQADVLGLSDSLLARYTKTQSDARYKEITWFPTWSEVTSKPSNFPTTYALSNDVQDSIQVRQRFLGYTPLNKADSLSGGYASWDLVKKKIDSVAIATVSGVSSFNSRSGAVVPLVGDYSSFYKGVADSFFVTGFTSRGRTKQVIDSLAATELSISDTASVFSNFFRTYGSQTVNGVKTFNQGIITSASDNNYFLRSEDIDFLNQAVGNSIRIHGRSNTDKAYLYFGSSSSNNIFGFNGTSFTMDGGIDISGNVASTKYSLRNVNGSFLGRNSAGNSFYGIYSDAGTEFFSVKTASTGSDSGVAVFQKSVTAESLIKSGGISSQILAADGSVITAGTNVTISGGNISASNSGGTVTSVSALTLGTSGTDLSSTVAAGTTTPVITLNVPNASASNRGVLSPTDWTTFNNKQSALTNPITGTGTSGNIPYFNGTTTQTSNGNLLWNTSLNALQVKRWGGVNIGQLALSVDGGSFNLWNGNQFALLGGVQGGTGDTAVMIFQSSRGTSGSGGYVEAQGYYAGGAFTTPIVLQRQGGNVLIGTTTNNGVDKLQVNGSISATNLSSGTYAPTASSLSNFTTVSPNTAQYLRIGNVVTVSGSINITPIANGGASFRLSIPISSNFTSTQQAGGTGVTNVVYEPANISSVASTATIVFDMSIVYSPAHTIYYSFTYQIL